MIDLLVVMNCRAGCGACCTAITISGPIPGVIGMKLAGVRCPQLSPENLCQLWNDSRRPQVCNSYQATREFCGETNAEAFELLEELESLTSGEPPQAN